jgi:Domain of unknown function (DUF222)
MELDLLGSEIERLAATDPFSYSDKESVIALMGYAAQLECVVSGALASFDEGGEWALDGAQSATAWIDTRCHLQKGEAKRALRLGRAMAHMPVVKEAWEKGDIKTAQVERLVKAKTPRTEESFCRDEEMLVKEAKKLKFDAFNSVMDYWENLADPDGANEADLARIERRKAWLAKSGGGYFGQMNFDQVSGTIVYDELSRIEKELFEADWAEAKERLGREPKVHELRRTKDQRGADAMVEMARRSGTTPAGGKRPRPLFTFLVGYETFKGRISELENGLVVSPDTMFPWMGEADFERVVFSPGKRIEVSVRSRLFKGATKRAIELRDRQCTHPYCDLLADKCQADHVITWNQGGPTQQENGRLLCGFHNRLRNGREPPDEGPG